MRVFLYISIFFCYSTASAQSGSIDIQQDPRIDSLMEKQLSLNKGKHGVEGFRVQIHFGQKRDVAQAIRTQFSTDFPELKTYLGYEVPYYKIRVGDFINRIEAYKVQKEISKEYKGAYIVPTAVDFEELTKKEPLKSGS